MRGSFIQRISEKISAEKFGFLPSASGEENTAALQKAVDAYESVEVTRQGIYDMAGTVKIPSDTHIKFADGVILRRTPLADSRLEGNLFINEGAFSGRFNENITLSGAHICVNGVESAGASPESENIITGLRGHIAFLYVKNLTVEDITITDLMKKDYAIQISDFENVKVLRVHLEGMKDGVHFGTGRNFVVKDSRFRTFDDAIAINCADYSVSNPNFGSISDGLIENCVELPGYKTESFFIRILTGTAREWQEGMTVYHSDAILTEKGMYRVVMQPDNTPYVSLTKPDFDFGYKELDGIMWVRTHLGYSRDEISAVAGCRNIVCRNITLENPRRRGVYIHTSFDEYLRSYYKGCEAPTVENLLFDGVKILKPVEHFVSANMPVKNIRIINSSVDESDMIFEPDSQMNN